MTVRTSYASLLALLFGCILSCAIEAAEYTSPGLGAIAIDLPADWRVQDRPGPTSVYLAIRPENGVSLQITSYWLPRDKLAGMTAESMRERVQGMAKGLLPNAVETEAPLTELKGKGGAGYYFHLTGRGANGPNQAKYLTQGMLATSVGFTLFTVLHPQAAIPEKMLEPIAAATYSRETLGSTGPTGRDAIRVLEQERTFEVWVPTAKLYMDLPRTRGLARGSPGLGGATDNPRYFYFNDQLFEISGWFEAAEKFKGVDKLWEGELEGWRRGGVSPPVDATFKKIGRWDAVEYEAPAGVRSHIRAQWVQAGTWIDIHISLMSSQPSAKTREALETYLQGVLVRDRTE
jgi:hypothetical protein